MVVSCGSRVLADKVRIATTFFTRFKGLMGRKKLAEGEGLLLMHCPSVHSFFMRIPIDCVYLAGDMTVLAVETLAPWRIGRRVKHTAHVLELTAGAAQVSAGDQITIQH